MRLVVAVALLGVLIGCAHPRVAARVVPAEPDPAVKLALPWQCITQSHAAWHVAHAAESANVRDWLITLRQARSKITVAGAGLMIEFIANPSDIQLVDGEPEETLEMRARGIFIDAEDRSHPVTLTVRGAVSNVSCVFASEGWDDATTVTALITGRTPEELRRLANTSGLPTGPVSLEEFFGLDRTTVEFGSGTVDEKDCKRVGRYWKTCGPDAKPVPVPDRPMGDFPLESDPHL
jgi:hypothetical protein